MSECWIVVDKNSNPADELMLHHPTREFARQTAEHWSKTEPHRAPFRAADVWCEYLHT